MGVCCEYGGVCVYGVCCVYRGVYRGVLWYGVFVFGVYCVYRDVLYVWWSLCIGLCCEHRSVLRGDVLWVLECAAMEVD